MKLLRSVLFFLGVVLSVVLPQIGNAGPFVAFSMTEAERQVKISNQTNKELMEMGGITRIAGMVYDERNKDLIIIGQVNKNEMEVTLDDFVVAMRAVLSYNEYPYVSIDKTEDTDKTEKLKINFRGGINDTNFGKNLLEADIILKQLSFGLLPSVPWGVKSYFSMSLDYLKDRPSELKNRIGSRFWFSPKNIALAVVPEKGVGAIRESSLTVETRVDYAIIDGKPISDLKQFQDEVGNQFASLVMNNYKDLCIAYPEIARLKILLDITAIVRAIQELETKPDLRFWLKDYKVKQVKTPQEYTVIRKKEKLEGSNNLRDQGLELELSGGIELSPIVLRLKAGDVTALRDAVLKSKPKENELTWLVPIEGWYILGSSEEDNYNEDTYSRLKSSNQKFGFSLDRQVYGISGQGNKYGNTLSKSFPERTVSNPIFSIHNNLLIQKNSPNVGGVMLQGAAKIAGSSEAKVDLTSGNFSLVVDGQNARLAPDAYRKFITALWSVYYSNQDPGVSIDPLGCFYFDPYDPERNQKFERCIERYQKKEEKHMVRYIGKVINTDLGRVMREADYLMKKWSVGTERPDIKGFKNPDEYRGWKSPSGGGSSRFWFVPDDMKFKRGGDLLLYEDGRMTVKTEFMFRNEGDMQSDPDNEKFASFFTKHYPEIAAKYPIYQELFDYAKMVSLAKYLKEQGIPLFWFLMANKDLVITEDSPGTVDALAKGSDYYKNLYIMGGVDLSFDVRREGNYVYDREAVKAINEAISQHTSNAPKTKSISDGKVIPASSEPFSFNLGKDSYTVVPQHTLTSGKDRHGVRYQTDIALRGTGLQLTDQTVEMTKYKIVRWEMATELNPILQDMDMNRLSESEIEALNKRIKEIREKAEEKTERICEKLKSLRNKRYMNEKEFAKALEETIGKEQTDKFKRLIMESAFYDTKLELVRYYKPGQQNSGEFGKGWNLLVPYRISPLGTGKRKFLNVMIPEKIVVVNLLTGEEEILAFSTDRYTIAGYVPEKIELSQVIGLFIMSDASYRLADKLGNEFWFNRAGYLTDMIFSEDHHIRFEYVENFTDAFEKAPYRVAHIGTERTEFLNVALPRKMEVKNLLHGVSEILIFSDKDDIAGYVPEDPEKSRFKILALMSDASFRLLDKDGYEIAFSPSGDFGGMAFPSDRPMVSSLSQGNQTIRFKYTLDKSGETMIASADISEGDKEVKPTYVVKYQYDDEGRLCKVIGSCSQVAENHYRQGNRVATSKR